MRNKTYSANNKMQWKLKFYFVIMKEKKCGIMRKETEETRGANEKTPSRSEYFSWINSTNEGSTQAQTLANLAFFRYLYDEYGMRLDIYAWDAGNLDGACGTYERADSEKLKLQYPNGYRPVVEADRKSTRLNSSHM